MEAAALGPLFKWETMKKVSPHTLRYRSSVPGSLWEVELTSGAMVQVFRADDQQMYFCHGLTFGGKEAPGGPVSPFSGKNVHRILEHHYRLLSSGTAATGDILVWHDPYDNTPHSAILIHASGSPQENRLDDASLVQTKNGCFPEEVMSLERLTGDEFGYGDAFKIYRRYG